VWVLLSLSGELKKGNLDVKLSGKIRIKAKLGEKEENLNLVQRHIGKDILEVLNEEDSENLIQREKERIGVLDELDTRRTINLILF
jgi:hypothetical protein